MKCWRAFRLLRFDQLPQRFFLVGTALQQQFHPLHREGIRRRAVVVSRLRFRMDVTRQRHQIFLVNRLRQSLRWTHRLRAGLQRESANHSGQHSELPRALKKFFHFGVTRSSRLQFCINPPKTISRKNERANAQAHGATYIFRQLYESFQAAVRVPLLRNLPCGNFSRTPRRTPISKYRIE